MDQAHVISSWLQRINRKDLNIIDVGCGVGWLCQILTQYGQVTATDLADEVIARAAQRAPSARFVAGDFMTLDFGSEQFDVATCLEVLPHVADQQAFVSKIASILKPSGYLMMATQNRPALERNDISPPGPGQIRHWLDRHELSGLLAEQFEIQEPRSVTPQFNRGHLRYLNARRLHSLLLRMGLGEGRQVCQGASGKKLARLDAHGACPKVGPLDAPGNERSALFVRRFSQRLAFWPNGQWIGRLPGFVLASGIVKR